MRRTSHDRRLNYEPAAPPEEFIVPLLRRKIEASLAAHAVPTRPVAHALDVGCGRQPFRHLIESAGYSYTGMDVEQNRQDDVDIVCAIDGALPIELIDRGSFDFLLCTEVLEHVADWDVAFRNLASLVAPGGRMLITCPHFYILHEEPHDYWRPTLHAIGFFANRVGLKVIEQEPAGDAWDVIGTVLASCYPVSASGKFWDRATTKMIRIAQRSVFKMLRDRSIQRRTRLQSSLYMSNILVLERA